LSYDKIADVLYITFDETQKEIAEEREEKMVFLHAVIQKTNELLV
jgi:uncharacterized protein YuzE